MFLESNLQVGWGWDPRRFQRSFDSRELLKVEGFPLGENFGIVLSKDLVREVVRIGKGVSHLLELVYSTFPGLVTTLYDVSCDVIGHVALLPRRPKLASVDVPLLKLSRSLDPLSSHVSCTASPHGIEPRSVSISGGVR